MMMRCVLAVLSMFFLVGCPLPGATDAPRGGAESSRELEEGSGSAAGTAPAERAPEGSGPRAEPEKPARRSVPEGSGSR